MTTKKRRLHRNGDTTKITLATLSVRGVEENTKREQIITHMVEHKIDTLCLETKMPGSHIERKDTHTFIFSSYIQGNEEHHGAGFCFSHNRNTEIIIYSIPATS